MSNVRLAIIFSCALVIALFFVNGILPQASATQSSQVQLGVFIPEASELGAFEANIGRQADIFLWYQAIGERLDTYTLGPIAASGHTIQMAWEPRDHRNPDGVNQPAYRLANITRGDFDNDIRRWARELRDFGYPVIFRPMCEMNGDWTSWGGNANGNQPADYIPAWRHIYDIFAQEGATNVKWVWSPNQDNTLAEAQNTFNTYYPGDAYVDYVGINGYNWGTMYSTPYWSSTWKSFTETFQYNYDVAVSRTSKPIMICETSSTEVGANAQNGGKARWITDAFAQLPQRFPRIVSLTWFNINKETDWRINSSAASQAAFIDAVHAPVPTEPEPSPITIEPALLDKWNSLDGAIGQATDVAHVVSGGIYQDFANGRLVFNQATGGTYWVHGALLTKYDQLGRETGPLGLPVSDEMDVSGVPGARESDFTNGRIYWGSGIGTFGIAGDILNKYLEVPQGKTAGGPELYGLPASDAYPAWSGWAQNTQKAIFTWDSSLGAHVVYGGIMGKYLMLGGPTGALHLATSDEMDVPDVPGARENDFQNGRVYWSVTTGGHTVNGGIYVKYMAAGGPSSRLGLPITDEYSIPLSGGGRRSQFQHGFVTWGLWYGTWVTII